MPQLNCQAVVHRMGEIFGEFGIHLPAGEPSAAQEVDQWQLIVSPASASDAVIAKDGVFRIPEKESDVVFNEVMDYQKMERRIVKLEAGRQYVVGVRFHTARWSGWSLAIRAGTFHPVAAKVEAIGEDYARLQWGRSAQRDVTGLAPEEDTAATSRLEDLANLELRVVREVDMVEECAEVFTHGERVHTVHGLTPGLAHIVMLRYETLIGSTRNWLEVGRFYTEPPNEVRLETRGEDVFSITWKRAALPAQTVGYTLPQTDAHRYELNVESDGLQTMTVEVPASASTHRFTELFPSTAYRVFVRALSTSGQWGCKSNVVELRTADKPSLEIVSTGETFLSLVWTRAHNEELESKMEYYVQSQSTAYRQQDTITVLPQTIIDGNGDERRNVKVFNVEHLRAGSEYAIAIRTYLEGEWGQWTEPRPFRTADRATLTFLERGEDFFTLAWPSSSSSAASGETALSTDRFHILVTQQKPLGERVVVLDQDVSPQPDQSGFRVSNLPANSEFDVQSRTWQFNPVTGFEGWGELSAAVRVRTLQPVALHVWDVGEDFAHVVWRRGLKLNEEAASTGAATSDEGWNILKYELVVGCVDTEEDALLHRQVLDTNYTITNLQPDTTYVVSVRACDERGQWGLWSKTRVRTLASIVSSLHEIGEDFVRLMWQRHSADEDGDENGSSSGTDLAAQAVTTHTTTTTSSGATTGAGASNTVVTADCFVSRYAVFVYSQELLDSDVVPDTESGYEAGGRADVRRYEVVSSDHTSTRVGDLLPDRVYVAVVRASTASGKWGLWSRPIKFRTNAPFCIPVNNLSIGENYVHLVWGRDAEPLTDREVQLGDVTVTAQQLRIRGVNTNFAKDHSLAADLRELKVYGLSPASAYTIQLRVCGASGSWGLWSAPVHVLTRGTILTKAVEVAEDYASIMWERRKVPNPSRYPTGKGVVTSYHLRVYNATGVHLETFLGDGDCPYRVQGLLPDTYYCVELKANYNDEEWGLWSTPLWCLTMQPLEVQTKLISEEFGCLSIRRPTQQRRLPEDDGNRPTEDRIIAFGQLRPSLMLCVTSPILTKTPHSSTGATTRPKKQNSSLPPDAADHRLIYQTEITSTSEWVEHTVPNLKSNTVYSVSARSKLSNGEWGMWSPSTLFATVPTMAVSLRDIGESFVRVEWARHAQVIPPQLEHPEKVTMGLGTVSRSRIRIRAIAGGYQHTYNVDSSLRSMRLDKLLPATTYAVAVQTYNDNYDWGVWSEEALVRTVPGMDISVEHISEDALWVSWTRLTDLDGVVDANTVQNVCVVPKSYEVCITGASCFRYAKETEVNALFFRGLQPDAVYCFHVRVQFAETEEWGLWSSQAFRTKPRMRAAFGSIGEHFAVVEWRRHLPTPLAEGVVSELPTAITETDDIVEQYRLRVQRVGEAVSRVYNLSPRLSSFRLKDLSPSSEYRVWMCTKGLQGVWGLWSQEARVRTLPKLSLTIADVGEDYVRVSWQRSQWAGAHVEDDDVEVRQVDGAVSGYQVRVLSESGEVVSTSKTGFRETSCVVSGLNLCALYTVQVCAKDTYDEWGLWSDARSFVTLHAVETKLTRLGETFVDISWCRSGPPTTSLPRTHNEDAVAAVAAAAADYETTPASPGGALHADGFPLSALREDERVLQWHVRVQSARVYGGQPDVTGEDAQREFYAAPDELHRRIDGLRPNATYFIAVRAKNRAGEWGHWCPPLSAYTYPLLTVSVERYGETFINLAWERAKWEGGLSDGSAASAAELSRQSQLACFPSKSKVHNYQVLVQPLPQETPFNEDDEPLVDGARVYDTTQPSIRLGNLTAGTRYRMHVREQHTDETGKAIDGEWGAASESRYVETVASLRVLPTEIGEDYCLLGWKRQPRARANQLHAGVPFCKAPQRIVEYELHTVRLRDEDGQSIYEGPLALDAVTTIPASAANTHNSQNLVHNAIYQVRIRAKGETGSWGPWSARTKFVTNGRLAVTAPSVYETSFALSWRRLLPAWAQLSLPEITPASPVPSSRHHPSHAASTAAYTHPSEDDRSSRSGSEGSLTHSDAEEAAEMDGSDEDERDGAHYPPSHHHHQHHSSPDAGQDPLHASDHPSLRDVRVGDYTIQRYEIVVTGLSCDFEQIITLDKKYMTTIVEGLEPNALYAVCVRSLSNSERWSRFSNVLSVLTLQSMQTVVAHRTESSAVLRWYREPTHLMQFADLLATKKAEADRACDERERKDLYQLKQHVHELESRGESPSSVIDQDLRRQHNALQRAEATEHLLLENVVVGRTQDDTGYHIRLEGDPCCVYVRHGEQLRLIDENAEVSASPRPSIALAKNDSHATSLTAAEMTTDKNAHLTPGTIVDMYVKADVCELTLENLRVESTYQCAVRSRCDRGVWQPWSERSAFETLPPITLCQSRFGEHYINLHWIRPCSADITADSAAEAAYMALQERYGRITQRELEAKRGSLPADEMEHLIEGLKQLREARRQHQLREQALMDGRVPILADAQTPIRGYHLRVVAENGCFTDYYIDARAPEATDGSEDAAATSTGSASATTQAAAFTVTGLQPNSMYVCLLCADYGPTAVGQWTAPLKFMTQNLIQLQLTYIGESFVDIEWLRAANKKLPPSDREDTLTSTGLQEQERRYQIRIEYEDPTTGAVREELRDMRASNQFRVRDLIPDAKCTIAVREWDAKGDWGLWCTPRACATLPGMEIAAQEAGEDWVTLGWRRLHKQQDYDKDMHILQYGVDSTAYFVRLTELRPKPPPSAVTGTPATGDSGAAKEAGEHSPESGTEPSHEASDNGEAMGGSSAAAQRTSEDGLDIELDGSDEEGHAEKQNEGEDEDEDEEGHSATRSPAHDELADVLASSAHHDDQDDERPVPFEGRLNGAYTAIHEFNEKTAVHTFKGLEPGNLYSVQVLAETTGGHLGQWSAMTYVQVTPKLTLRAVHIGEESMALQWARATPQPAPSYIPSSAVFHSASLPVSYELRVAGADGFSLSKTFDAHTTSTVLTGLSLNTVYKASVRSTNTKQHTSLWSDALHAATPRLLSVQPSEVAEQYTIFTWGRGVQTQAQYTLPALPSADPLSLSETTDAETTDAPPTIVFSQDPVPAYHLRILAVKPDGTTEPFLEREIDGSETSLKVDALKPNSAYVATVRAADAYLAPAWGRWSAERCVYTMKPVQCRVAAVGEDFIRMEWTRAAPDAVTVSSAPLTTRSSARTSTGPTGASSARPSASTQHDELGSRRGSGDNAAAEFANDDNDITTNNYPTEETFVGALAEHDAAVRFALQDQPAQVPAVYHTAQTTIASYLLSVRPSGESEPYTIRVDGQCNHWTIPNLGPDRVYTLSLRLCYASGECSPWSEVLRAGTYNLLEVELKHSGETHLGVAWQRQSNTVDVQTLSLGRVEETVCYELVVRGRQSSHNPSLAMATGVAGAASSSPLSPGRPTDGFTEASAMPVDDSALPTSPLLPADTRSFFVPPRQRHFIVTGLASNRRYEVAVRRWYGPLESFVEASPRAVPRTDDAAMREVIEAAHAVPGRWSESEFALTLPDMACQAEFVDEDAFSVRWERDLRNSGSLSVRGAHNATAAQQHNIRIDQWLADGTGPDKDADTLHVDQTLGQDEHRFVVKGLKPCRVYRVDVRSCVSKVWGQWSRPVYVLTLPKLEVSVDAIGEDTATVAWSRQIPSYTMADGIRTISGTQHADQGGTGVGYQLEVNGMGAAAGAHLIKRIKPGRNSYTLRQLDAGALYSVRVRMTSEEHLASPAMAGATTATTSAAGAATATAASTSTAANLWSEVLFFASLKPLSVRLAPPAEQFIYVQWRRSPQTAEEYEALLPTQSSPTGDAVTVLRVICGSAEVQAYQLCVFRGDTTPSTAVIDKQLKKDVSRYRVGGLEPNTPYVVVLRASTAPGQWGLWSREMAFRTPPLLSLSLVNFGETYATVCWQRAVQASTDDAATTDAEPTRYALVARCADEGSGTGTAGSAASAAPAGGLVKRTFAASECRRRRRSRLGSAAGTADDEVAEYDVDDDEELAVSYVYRLEGLEADHRYVLAIQPCYSAEEDWGLWSETLSFATLAPVEITLTTLDNRVEMNWKRRTATAWPGVSTTTASHSDVHGPRDRSVAFAGDAHGPSDPLLAVGAATVQRYQFVACRAEDRDRLLSAQTDAEAGSTVGHEGSPTAKAGGFRIPDRGDQQQQQQQQRARRHSSLADGQPLGIPDMADQSAQDVRHASRDDTASLAPTTPPANARQTSDFLIETELDGDEAVNADVHTFLQRLEMDSTYVIRIRALDNSGTWGAWTESILDTPPLPPTNVVLRKVNAQMCALQWDPPRGTSQPNHTRYRYVVEQQYTNHGTTSAGAVEDGYVAGGGVGALGHAQGGPVAMRRATTTNVLADWRVVDVVEEPVCAVRILGPTTRLRCRVRCCRLSSLNAPFSSFSETVVLSKGSPPEPAVGLVVTELGRELATLQWTPSPVPPGAAANLFYRVYVSEKDGPPILLATVAECVYTVSHLSPSTEHTAQVVAQNGDGISFGNPAIRFTTRPADDATILRDDGSVRRVPLGLVVDPNADARAAERQREAAATADIPVASSLKRPSAPALPKPGGASARTGRRVTSGGTGGGGAAASTAYNTANAKPPGSSRGRSGSKKVTPRAAAGAGTTAAGRTVAAATSRGASSGKRTASAGVKRSTKPAAAATKSRPSLPPLNQTM